MALNVLYIGLIGQGNATNISFGITESDVIPSTCQVDFETINNQPAVNPQPTMSDLTANSATTNLSVNATLSTSATLVIVVSSIAGGITGLCIIFICIVGLIAIKTKRKQGNPRRGIFTAHSLNSMYVQNNV